MVKYIAIMQLQAIAYIVQCMENILEAVQVAIDTQYLQQPIYKNQFMLFLFLLLLLNLYIDKLIIF
jgi:hypothetical protein